MSPQGWNRLYNSWIQILRDLFFKVAPKKLLQYVEHDVRYDTGSNIRQLLLENNKRNLSDIEFKGQVLHPVPASDEWRIDFALI